MDYKMFCYQCQETAGGKGVLSVEYAEKSPLQAD